MPKKVVHPWMDSIACFEQIYPCVAKAVRTCTTFAVKEAQEKHSGHWILCVFVHFPSDETKE